MPETNTASGFQTRILEAVPTMNRNYAKRVAYRLKRRAERMQEHFDFDRELRILGIISDPTSRDAIRNIETAGGEAARRLGLVAA